MGRRRELDSLRGLAAIAVLTFHTLAYNFMDLSRGASLFAVTGATKNVLVYSPLHIFWVGAEAVWMFFILSGFVLTRAAKSPSSNWSSYYPSRLARLYLPVAIAVGFAWCTYLARRLFGPGPDPSMAVDYPVANMLHDLTLLNGTTQSLGVLWSLQWEVAFSLMLPVYVFLARRHPLATSAVALPLMFIGWGYGDGVTSYLPMFFIGSLMAMHWDRVRSWFAFLDRRGAAANIAGVAILAFSVCAVTSYYLLGRQITGAGHQARQWTVPIVLLGNILIIVAVQAWAPLRRVLGTRAAVFLGTISFSLYLVHLPIVMLVIYFVGPGRTSAVVGFVVALAAAVGFYFLAERPAHRLSRRIGSQIRDREVQASTELQRESIEIGASQGPRAAGLSS